MVGIYGDRSGGESSDSMGGAGLNEGVPGEGRCSGVVRPWCLEEDGCLCKRWGDNRRGMVMMTGVFSATVDEVMIWSGHSRCLKWSGYREFSKPDDSRSPLNCIFSRASRSNPSMLQGVVLPTLGDDP
jgi:hypothetical protein